MQTKITENEKQLRDLLNEMWQTQHGWQYRLLDLLNNPEVDLYVRQVRYALNNLESTISASAASFNKELLERAE